jgi:hypothetical protein
MISSTWATEKHQINRAERAGGAVIACEDRLQGRVVTGVTIVSAMISAGFASRYAMTRTTILPGVAAGALIGVVLASLEILLRGPAASTMRRLPLPMVFLLRTAIYGGIFVGANISVALLSHLPMPEAPLPGLATFNPGNLLFFVAVALASNFGFLLRGLLGGRMLIALLTGRCGATA